MIYRKYVKRLLDVAMAFFAILILSPVFIVMGIIIRCDSDGPVFFRQVRYGRDKKLFHIYKFRTMYAYARHDLPSSRVANVDRMTTKTGRFLRRSGLDELPQLVNILAGQMSFVGPRPVIRQEASLIVERDRYGANSVTPGLTGWAQVNGRDSVTPIEKARLDGEYVQKMSFLFDCKCILMTFSTLRNPHMVAADRNEDDGAEEQVREGIGQHCHIQQ